MSNSTRNRSCTDPPPANGGDTCSSIGGGAVEEVQERICEDNSGKEIWIQCEIWILCLLHICVSVFDFHV